MGIFDNIVVAPFEQGQRKKGVGNGAHELNSLLLDVSRDMGINVLRQYSLVVPNSNDNKKWGDDYKILHDILKGIESYTLFGGDHSVGQSSVAASLTKVTPSNLIVIWIDAHADTNTYESSISKNFHGMPLAGIVGYEKPWFDFDLRLPTSNLLYFGIRDLDDFEEKKINENNIFHTKNLKNMVDKINEIILNNPNVKFHVSWDVDSLDPKIFDSTGCLADDGLTLDDINGVMDCVKSQLIALDIVEFNPKLGNRQKSVDILREFLVKNVEI